MSRSLLWLEARILQRSGTPLTIGVLFVLISLAAIANGAVLVRQQQRAAHDAEREQVEQHAALARDLALVEQQRTAAGVPLTRLRQGLPSATAVEARLQHMRLALPPLPVTLLGAGGGQSLPPRYEIRSGGGARYWPFGRTVDDRILSGFASETPTDNPSALVLGAFDLAFVAIYLYPLLIITLTYNIVSADRESGVLTLVAAQPIAFQKWLAGRAVLRGAIVLTGVTLPIVAATVAIPDWSTMTWLRLAIWLAASLLYCTLWFAVVLLISLRTASAASSAMVSVVVWLVGVIVIPALVVVVQPLLAPASARIAFASEERPASLDINPRVDAAVAALNQQLRQLQSAVPASDQDHPSFTEPLTPTVGADLIAVLDPAVWTLPMPATHLSRGFSVARRVMTERRLAPVLRQLDAQERSEAGFYALVRYSSPALLLHSLLNDAAGSGPARRARLLEQFDTHVREREAYFTQRILENRNVTSHELQALRPFQYRDESASAFLARSSWPLIALAVMCAAALWVVSESIRRWS